jgi:hypothetical protein
MLFDPTTGRVCRSIRRIVGPDGSTHEIRVLAGGESAVEWFIRKSYVLRMLLEELLWEFQ